MAAAGCASLPSGGGSGSGGGESYEDLCKAHIDAFMHAAAAAEVQTELASRCAHTISATAGNLKWDRIEAAN